MDHGHTTLPNPLIPGSGSGKAVALQPGPYRLEVPAPAQFASQLTWASQALAPLGFPPLPLQIEMTSGPEQPALVSSALWLLAQVPHFGEPISGPQRSFSSLVQPSSGLAPSHSLITSGPLQPALSS